MRTNLWAWSGDYIGYRENDQLWSFNGDLIGRFFDEEIYGVDGSYLGELRKNDRLICKLSKKSKSRAAISPRMRGGCGTQGNRGAFGMLGGYEDFPHTA